MTLKDKYPKFKLIHFIDMYDNVISIEGHALNAKIFEDKEYIDSILNEINDLKKMNEEFLALNYMKLCHWIDENEMNSTRIKKELESVRDL